MENNDKIVLLIKYGNYCLDNCIFTPLKSIFDTLHNIDTKKYKNEIFILKCRKKEMIDYFSLDDLDKLNLIKTINDCNQLINNNKYEEALKKLYDISNKIKHDILLYYKGICLYHQQKFNKAEKSLRDYTYKGYSKQLDAIILLIQIYVDQKQFGKARNYLSRYNNISKILKKYDEQTYEELSKLINSKSKIFEKNKSILSKESDINSIVNDIIKLLKQNKIKDVFNIVDNLKLETLKLAKIKLRIVEFLYKNKLNDYAKKYYNDIVKTPNKDNELKEGIKKLEMIKKLYK